MLLVSAFALLSMVGSAELASAGTVPPHKAGAVGATRRSDPEIEQIIKAKLAKSKIGKDGFTARVKNGIVTWEGSTNVVQHKGAATRMARTSGATQVVNNIKISDAARQRASGNLTGSPKRALVKNE